MPRDNTEITKRQAEVLTFILDHITSHGYPPTVAEIATRFGFKSPNAAASHLNALRKKNFISIEARASRGIRVLKTPDGFSHVTTAAPQVPIVGHVAAGSPILAEESITDRLTLDADAFQPAPDYFLRVQGDSMMEVGIFEGDLIAVKRTQDVRQGEVVVANVNGEVTVKTLQTLSAKKVVLKPENSTLPLIVVNPATQEFSIEGKVVGLLRAF